MELSEFKRVSCVDVNLAIPEIKFSTEKPTNPMNNCNNNFAQNLNDEEDDSQKDDAEEQRLHMIHVNKRKRRKYINSFFNAFNLFQWDDNYETRGEPQKTDNYIQPGNLYWMRSIQQEYELKEKRWVMHNMKTIIKLDEPYGMSC